MYYFYENDNIVVKYNCIISRSTPITARKPAGRAVRHSNSNVTGVHKSTSTKSTKKGLTVRVDRETVENANVSVESKRATTSRASADVSIVDRLAKWEKKIDEDRSVADGRQGRCIWEIVDRYCRQKDRLSNSIFHPKHPSDLFI